MSSLEALQAQVAASNSVIDSAVQLINGLQARLQSAIEAAKAGDDTKALALLDDAIARQEAGTTAARSALDAVNQRVAARIATKFDTTDKPAP